MEKRKLELKKIIRKNYLKIAPSSAEDTERL